MRVMTWCISKWYSNPKCIRIPQYYYVLASALNNTKAGEEGLSSAFLVLDEFPDQGISSRKKAYRLVILMLQPALLRWLELRCLLDLLAGTLTGTLHETRVTNGVWSEEKNSQRLEFQIEWGSKQYKYTATAKKTRKGGKTDLIGTWEESVNSNSTGTCSFSLKNITYTVRNLVVLQSPLTVWCSMYTLPVFGNLFKYHAWCKLWKRWLRR